MKKNILAILLTIMLLVTGCSEKVSDAETMAITIATSVAATQTKQALEDSLESTQPIEEIQIPTETIIVIATPSPVLYTVSRVIDGDTIELTTGEKVRLLGIDTPEVGECGYDEATEYLFTLINGKEIELVEDNLADDIDRYGRLLRYIEIEGLDINLQLVKNGFADSFKYDSSTGYPYDREELYHNAQGELFECVPTPIPTQVPTIYVPVPTSKPVNSCAGRNFANCTAVRNAGCAPVYESDSWYQGKFDRDKDGIGCE